MAAIDVRGLTFKYPLCEKAAIEDISFTAAEGETVLVCGEGGNFVLQTQTNFDLQPVMQMLRTVCGARGGGRGNVMQGSVHADKETLQSLLESAGKTAK